MEDIIYIILGKLKERVNMPMESHRWYFDKFAYAGYRALMERVGHGNHLGKS